MKKNRLQEPSTWAGLGIIFTAIASVPGPHSVICGALAAATGGVAVMLREGQ